MRLVLAAAGVATALAPAIASAGVGCTLSWSGEEIGPVQYRHPRCAW
jgi:hypothetical protein